MKKVLSVLAVVIALLPAVVYAHENGPHHNYEVLVPGEVPGLAAVLVVALTLLIRIRKSQIANRKSPLFTGLTLSLLSGALLYLSFPPFDLGWLAWIALVPMIVAQLRCENPNLPISQSPNLPISPSLISNLQSPNLYQALTIFVVYSLVFMHVFPSELPTGFPVPVWPLILVGIALVCVGFYWTGLPGGSIAFHRKTNFKFFIIGPALGWIGMELVRVIIELGQGWARIPSTQHANIPLIQLSTLGGQWLIGALVIAANYAIAALVSRFILRLRSGQAFHVSSFGFAQDKRFTFHAPRLTIQALITLSLIIAAHFIGNTLINTPSQTVRVAAIQLGEDLGDSPDYMTYWNRADWQGMNEAVLRDFEPMIREAAARGAKLIALPEAVLWTDPALDLKLLARLTNLAKETGAYITFTFYLWNDPNSRNEVYTATPRGEWLGPYAKNHPIAYIGEYSVTAGKFPVYQTPFGGLSNFVCYDNAYTDVAARLAGNGTSILTSSNHDWPEGAWGFYTQAIYRASENRLAIVRSDWRVGSAIIDPFGRVLASAKWDEREKTIVIADVPIIPERGTLYTRYGDWIAYAGLGVLAAMTLAGVRWPRRLRTVPQVT